MAVDLTKLEKKFIDLFANVTQEEFEQWLLTKATKPMAQQTAVDWLERRVEERKNNNPMETAYWHLKEFIKDFEQAKQMEREQRIAAQMDMFHHMDNADYGLDYLQKRDEAERYAEQYYNETYKQS